MVGFARIFRILSDTLCLKILQIFYGFHSWHANAPMSARPYRYDVANLVNALKPNCVVEVGCGLGGILTQINAPHRFGYDTELNVIRAARFLRSSKIVFTEGDMTKISESNIDVLILCNWIHEFSPKVLESWITPLLPRISYLLLDAIDTDGDKGYKYKHDFRFLSERAFLISKSRSLNEGRTFIMYKVKK